MLDQFERAVPTLLFGAFALFALWFIVKKLDFSATRLIKVVMKEIPGIASAPWTRGSLNGMGLIFVATSLVLYFLLDRVRQLVELLHNVNSHGAHSSSLYEFTISWVGFGLLALLSARSLPPSQS